MKSLAIGHVLLIICCLFYLIWWCVAFRPGYQGPRVSGTAGILLMITAAAGLAGVIFSVHGIRQPGSRTALLPSGSILIGGLILYVILLITTSLFLHRQVTTELFLIIGWMVLELLSFQSAYRFRQIERGTVFLLIMIAVIAAVLSLIFYLQYYQVSEMRGYIYGMIPLILFAVCMAVFLILNGGYI